jgi:hypothetical protein
MAERITKIVLWPIKAFLALARFLWVLIVKAGLAALFLLTFLGVGLGFAGFFKFGYDAIVNSDLNSAIASFVCFIVAGACLWIIDEILAAPTYRRY